MKPPNSDFTNRAAVGAEVFVEFLQQPLGILAKEERTEHAMKLSIGVIWLPGAQVVACTEVPALLGQCCRACSSADASRPALLHEGFRCILRTSFVLRLTIA